MRVYVTPDGGVFLPRDATRAEVAVAHDIAQALADSYHRGYVMGRYDASQGAPSLFKMPTPKKPTTKATKKGTRP